MAEQVFKQLEEQLNCSICLDTYTDPKLLQCFHVYCQQCLVPLVDRNQQGQLGLTCPSCRQVTPVPDRGVASLQSAFLVNRLLEIRESSQNPAATPVREAPADVNPDEMANNCYFHEGKELELYCETCGELICWKCIAKGSKHHDHDYDELDQAFKKYREEIASKIEPMEKQVETVHGVLALFDARCMKISDQRAATADKMHVTFRRLREVLDVRETELIGQLDEVTQGKLKGLAAQRDQIETTLAQLNSCLHFMRESLRTGNERDVLTMKANTVSQAKTLSTPFQPDPFTEADQVFSASADMTAVCRNYGQIFSPSAPDPSKCHIVGKVAGVTTALEKCTAVLQAINFNSVPCKDSIESLECKVLSEKTGALADCSIEKRGQSQYEINYRPTIKGRHQLDIKVGGRRIRGSPFRVVVKLPVEKLGTPCQTVYGVTHPFGVAFTRRGDVVVTESAGNCVSVFDPSGEKVRSFGKYGSRRKHLNGPSGVAVDGEGNIVIADSGNYRIKKFTPEGRYLASVGTYGTGQLQFVYPSGIVVKPGCGKLYVTDAGKHCVTVLNPDFTFSGTFGKEGNGKGQLNQPFGIACDSTGKVYVADQNNHRIQIFTADGRFLRMFGRELVEPFGVAIDSGDMVYVSEVGFHRISVFTSEGQFVTSFGREGVGPGEFLWPRGLAVDNCGVVYVCDSKNHRIQLF